MIASGLASFPVRDLPVCFPGRPCLPYPPLEADVINVTSDLTDASEAIAIGCFAVLGVALVLVALGLTRRSGLSLWTVALSTSLIIAGAVIGTVVDARFSALLAVYGREGSGGPEVYGSWWLVGVAGQAMAVAGLVGLVVTAAVAIVWLRAMLSADRTPAA